MRYNNHNKPYNEIITFKNLEIAVLKNITNEYIEKHYNGIIQSLLIFYKKYIDENKKEIIDYVEKLYEKNKEPQIHKTRIYSMSIKSNYEKIKDSFNNYFNNN